MSLEFFKTLYFAWEFWVRFCFTLMGIAFDQLVSGYRY
jgi:hypothetical protein